jgi:hypothetical protein
MPLPPSSPLTTRGISDKITARPAGIQLAAQWSRSMENVVLNGEPVTQQEICHSTPWERLGGGSGWRVWAEARHRTWFCCYLFRRRGRRLAGALGTDARYATQRVRHARQRGRVQGDLAAPAGAAPAWRGKAATASRCAVVGATAQRAKKVDSRFHRLSSVEACACCDNQRIL